MATDLGTTYSPSFTGQPPHMSREDTLIWSRYWPTIRAGTLRLWFDVGLGQGRPSPAGTPENLARMWTRLNQKRADVITETPDAVHIIELRDAAQSNAVGRLQTYAMLWKEDPPISKPLKLDLITNTEDLDVKALCALVGINYRVM